MTTPTEARLEFDGYIQELQQYGKRVKIIHPGELASTDCPVQHGDYKGGLIMVALRDHGVQVTCTKGCTRDVIADGFIKQQKWREKAKENPPNERYAKRQANGEAPTVRELQITKASAIQMRATRWLWEDEYGCWIPMGALVLLGGRESVGKSTLTAHLIANVTNGTLRGDFYGRPRNVIISTTEDDWPATIKPRLAAAGADMDRVLQVNAVSPEGLEGTLSLPEDTKRLEELVKDNDVALIVLDPLLTMINAKLDTHKDAEVRRALEPIVRLAQTSGASLVGLIHVNKTSEGDLSTRVMGSKALVAVPRGVLFCAKYETDEPPTSGDLLASNRPYVFGQIKNNLAATVPRSIQYHMETQLVGYDEDLDKQIKASRLVIDKVLNENIEDIVLAQEKKKTKTKTQASKAEQWLTEYLTGKGATPSKWVINAARSAGFSRDSVYAARRNLEDLIEIDNLPTVPKTSTWRLLDSDEKPLQ